MAEFTKKAALDIQGSLFIDFMILSGVLISD